MRAQDLTVSCKLFTLTRRTLTKFVPSENPEEDVRLQILLDIAKASMLCFSQHMACPADVQYMSSWHQHLLASRSALGIGLFTFFAACCRSRRFEGRQHLCGTGLRDPRDSPRSSGRTLCISKLLWCCNVLLVYLFQII